MKRFASILLIFLVISYFIFPKMAFAYVEPGTGSFFIQLFLSFFLGTLFLIKIFWKRIKSFFGHLFLKRAKSEQDNGEK